MGTIYVASKRRDVINILIFSLRVPTQLVTTISVIMSTDLEGEKKIRTPTSHDFGVSNHITFSAW